MLLGLGRRKNWRVVYKGGDSSVSEAMDKRTALSYAHIFDDAIAVEKFRGLFKRRIEVKKRRVVGRKDVFDEKDA